MKIRVLCLGNPLVADDGFGPAVAARLRALRLPELEVVDSAESGFYLLDHLLDCRRLFVVDTVRRGDCPSGTVHEMEEGASPALVGSSPHYVGLFETLAVARRLGLSVPDEVRLLAVEAEDLETLGGPMTAPVAAAVENAVGRILDVCREDAPPARRGETAAAGKRGS